MLNCYQFWKNYLQIKNEKHYHYQFSINKNIPIRCARLFQWLPNRGIYSFPKECEWWFCHYENLNQCQRYCEMDSGLTVRYWRSPIYQVLNFVLVKWKHRVACYDTIMCRPHGHFYNYHMHPREQRLRWNLQKFKTFDIIHSLFGTWKNDWFVLVVAYNC